MSLIDLLLAAEAAGQDHAVRRTSFRHRHVTKRPLVIAAFNLSGEAAAPLGICYGTHPKRPKLVVAAEPRNRDSRFGAINEFAADLVTFIEPYLELVEIDAGRPGRTYRLKVASDAPQIVVPNSATRNFLGARLGRSLRYLGLGETHEVPDETQWAGAHLSWLAEHAHFPGQSIFLSATELLGRHFITGQSALENENLASLIAWIDNPEGSGTSLMDAAEDAAFGPEPDPTWEGRLERHVKAYTAGMRAGKVRVQKSAEKKVADLVRAEIVPAYDATFRSLEIMRSIPESATSPSRWTNEDLRGWSNHARRCERGIPRFARRHDAIRAARMLQRWSSALEKLEADEAFDDPMVMAGLDTEGLCVSGSVTAVDLTHKEVKPGNQNATQVPLVTIAGHGGTRLLPGASVVWTENRAVKAEVRAVGASIKLAIMGGHNRGARVPIVGADVVLASLDPFGGQSPQDPEGTPWTHRSREEIVDSPGETPAQETVSDALAALPDDSPDLTVVELGDLPLLGTVEPDDVPGVVQ